MDWLQKAQQAAIRLQSWELEVLHGKQGKEC